MGVEGVKFYYFFKGSGLFFYYIAVAEYDVKATSPKKISLKLCNFPLK